MNSGSPNGEQGTLAYAHFRVHQREDGSPWVLGMGGMGVTYKASDTRLRVEVALKVIHPARLGDPDVQRLFVREARAAARVGHPNVAAISYLEDRGAEVFYAMEFVDGLSLHAWLRRHGPLPTGQALAFAGQIAHGLAAIHGQHLIHRDLKPPNVMVVTYPEGHPRHAALADSGGCLLKIIDFGLARAVSVSAADLSDADAPLPTAGFRGTAAYASPEQCEEMADLDPRSDLYSLGCMLWELLTGRPPFVGRTHRETLNVHVSGRLPWSDVARFPPAVVAVLRGLLARSREDRFADAASAAAALADAQRLLPAGGGPDLAPPSASPAVPASTPAFVSGSRVGGSPPGSSGTRITLELPPRWWVGATAIGLLLLLGLAGIAWWRFGVRPPPPPVAGAAATPPATAEPPTVAVLRFTDLGGDAAAELFARGMSEDLLSSLAKVRGLRLISLQSTQIPTDLDRLGLAKGRRAFLEGSVRRQGSRVRITTRLTDAATSQQLWSETYERELIDAFEIQRSVAHEIARALAANLTPAEENALAERPTRNSEAYEAWLKGRTLWQSGPRTLAANEEVVQLCERAVALDPDFALAWAYLARAQNVIYFYAFDRSPERLLRARRAAETAIRLQPNLAEAHIAFARVQWFEDPNPEVLLRAYNVALAITPGNAEILTALADIHRQRDQMADALAASREAAARAPDDASKLSAVGNTLAEMRRYAEAEGWFKRSLDLAPGDPGRTLRYHLCIAERTGGWERYLEQSRALVGRMPPEQRWSEQWRTRDFRGALESLQEIKDAEIATNWQRVPKTLVTSAIHRALGDEAAALADGRAALAAMQASTAAVTVLPGWQIKLALAHARAGDPATALTLGEAALRAAPAERGAIVQLQVMDELAELCAETGQAERGCELISELLARPWWGSQLLVRYAPAYDGLRGHPRFQRLIEPRP